MTRVLLARHGESVGNAAGLVQGQGGGGLSALGRRQAQEVVTRLQHENIAAIYSSDLARAMETAEIVAAAMKNAPPVIGDSLLREQCFGVYEGRPVWQLLRAVVKAGAVFTSFDPEGGEPAGLFRVRTAGFLDTLVERHPGETVLLVTHYGFIHMARQMFAAGQCSQGPFPAVSNGSITIVDLDRRGSHFLSGFVPDPEGVAGP